MYRGRIGPLVPSCVPLYAAPCRYLPGLSRNSPFLRGSGSFCGAEGRTFESCRARQ